jgi:hypothetical protein
MILTFILAAAPLEDNSYSGEDIIDEGCPVEQGEPEETNEPGETGEPDEKIEGECSDEPDDEDDSGEPVDDDSDDEIDGPCDVDSSDEPGDKDDDVSDITDVADATDYTPAVYEHSDEAASATGCTEDASIALFGDSIESAPAEDYVEFMPFSAPPPDPEPFTWDDEAPNIFAYEGHYGVPIYVSLTAFGTLIVPNNTTVNLYFTESGPFNGHINIGNYDVNGALSFNIPSEHSITATGNIGNININNAVYGLVITGGGSLTLAGEVNINSRYDSIDVDGGNLIIAGSTNLTRVGEGSTNLRINSGSSAVVNSSGNLKTDIIENKNGVLKINGGNVTIGDKISSEGVFTINDGTVKITNGIDIIGEDFNINSGTVTITDGDITSDGGEININGGTVKVTGIIDSNGGDVNISDAIVEITDGGIDSDGGNVNINNSTLTIIEGCILAYDGDVNISNSTVTITTVCGDHSTIEASSIEIINSFGSLSSKDKPAVLASSSTTLHVDPAMTVWKLDDPTTLAIIKDKTHFADTDGLPLNAVEFATFTVAVINGTRHSGYTTGGSTVHITANQPSEGHVFAGWTVTPLLTPALTLLEGTTLSDPLIKFTMPFASFTITANFEPEEHTISVTSIGNGVATATAQNAVVTKAVQDTEITLTATPEIPGNKFVRWEVLSGGITLSSTTDMIVTFVMPDNDVEVRAVFEPEPEEHAIIVTRTGNGFASATVQNTVVTKAVQDTVVTLTATPELPGNKFVRWEVLGGNITLSSTTDMIVTFVMPDEDVAVRAIFEATAPGEHAIIVTYTGNGVASANVNAAIQGTEITLTAKPDTGNRFVRWEVRSGDITLSSTTNATATFIMPDEDVTVRAVFRPIAGTTTPTSPQMGDVAGTGILFALMAIGAGGMTFAGIKAISTKRKK